MARNTFKNSISPCSSLPVTSVGDGKITTIKGLSVYTDHPMEQPWLKHDAAQNSYHQAGQIMSTTALIISNANLSNEEIEAAMSGNLYRCGTYLRIKKNH